MLLVLLYKKPLQHLALCGKDINVRKNIVQYIGKRVALKLGDVHSGRVSKCNGRRPMFCNSLMSGYSVFCCGGLCIGV